jgi:ribonucleoside-diphosphate reductase beta chain
MGRKAINWNNLSKDSIALRFWNQNVQQFWLPEDFSPSQDLGTWQLLSPEYKEVYKKVLVGLTHLDTEQGGEGMPLILLHVKNQHYKAILSFMCAMEQIHAKSYSNIFQSLITDKMEEKELFDWQENHPILQRKAEIIIGKYHKLFNSNPSKKDLYMAMVASVFLESFLFYSGFFFPLYLAGQGKMINSAEIINAIIKDESIHGLLVGFIAQEVYAELSPEEQQQVDKEVYKLLDELFALEVEYTKDVYEKIGLVDEVIEYVKYNANKALNNLGREEYFEVGEVNPIILNGLNTETKNHDFFSTKGNSYIKSVNIKPVSDEDFAKLEEMLGITID